MAEELTPSVGWQIADALTAVVDSGRSRQASGIATVSGTDSEGRVWVHLPGSVNDTPVNGSSVADCEPGQSVSYTIANGRLSITGNASNPSVGQENVDRTIAPVSLRMDAISEIANTAKEAADAAVFDASRANEAASSAQSSANSAAVAAGNAQSSANAAATAAGNAQASADNANEYAARALGNLSTVQSVTETLAWITQHGTMALTADTEPDPTHVYFVADAGGDYVVGSAHYSLVIEPVAADMATYYELTIDESLNNYVGTHLSLTAEGLWLLPASSGAYRILIATGAGTTYTEAGTYIIDANGGMVAQFGTVTRIGHATESHVDIDYHSMALVDKEGDTYFRVSDLRDQSGSAEIVDSFVGDGTKTSWNLSHSALDDEGTVTVDGVEVTDVSFFYMELTFVNSYVPADGAVIEATYMSEDTSIKEYTLGVRGTGNVGGMSVAEGLGCVASGGFAHAEGYGTTASGYASHAEGAGTTAKGSISHAEGAGTVADGEYSHAEGSSSRAKGRFSHAEGVLTTASGDYSHAEGASTTASGGYSHAEGNQTTASKVYTHAEGYGSEANSAYSHAEGWQTEAAAGGFAGHAEGYKTKTSGYYAHAEGYYSTAHGTASHAQNRFTIANGDNQTAIGKYNVADTSSALIIGNGDSDSSRSNALTVSWSGGVSARSAALSDNLSASEASVAHVVVTKDSSRSDANAIRVSDGTDAVCTIDWDGNAALATGKLTIEATAGYIYLIHTTDGTTEDVRYRIGISSVGIPDMSASTDGGTTYKTVFYNAIYANRPANRVLASPNGSTGAASFRSLVAADLPTVTRAKGGTGVTGREDTSVTVDTSHVTAGTDNHLWHNGILVTVSYNFTLKASLGSTNVVNVGTVPVGYRPPYNVVGSCYTANSTNMQCTITSGGAIMLRNTSGAAFGTGTVCRIGATYAI